MTDQKKDAKTVKVKTDNNKKQNQVENGIGKEKTKRNKKNIRRLIKQWNERKRKRTL